MDVNDFINQIAEETNDDYPQAFKLLGFVVYVAQEGSESLLTGKMISQRTYYRWLGLVQRAGWGDLLAGCEIAPSSPGVSMETICWVTYRPSQGKSPKSRRRLHRGH